VGGKEGKRVQVGSQLYTDDHKPKAKRTKTRRKAKKTKRGTARSACGNYKPEDTYPQAFHQ
jgi:hypothetical protein